MNNQKLEKIFKVETDSISGNSGNWEITYKKIPMLVLTDEKNGRMRIISPITQSNRVDESIIQNCMLANFHTALDVKYAISDGIIWAVYIHPLNPLVESQVLSALKQIYSAVITFGTTYSSTDLLFGGSKKRDEPEKKEIPSGTKT